MWSDFSQYYFSDWLAMVSTMLWIYLSGEKKRIGFIFATIASISWLVFGYLNHSVASILANTICIALNIQAYIKWKNWTP